MQLYLSENNIGLSQPCSLCCENRNAVMREKLLLLGIHNVSPALSKMNKALSSVWMAKRYSFLLQWHCSYFALSIFKMGETASSMCLSTALRNWNENTDSTILGIVPATTRLMKRLPSTRLGLVMEKGCYAWILLIALRYGSGNMRKKKKKKRSKEK